MHCRLVTGCLTVAALAWSAGLASAQTAYPMLMSLKPVAAQTGSSSVHTISSRYSMHGANQVLVNGQGVTGEVVTKSKPVKPGAKVPNLTKLQVRFTIAKNALPGVRDFRIITPRGASTIGQLVIVRDPVVSEKSSNNTPATAQAIKLPATICGAVERVEDVDYFKFSAKKGQSLSFHVRSMRLQDRIHDLQKHVDPILSLKTATGTTLVQSDNHFAADPFLNIRIPRDGEYLLEIRDVRYHGNAYWEYSIESNARSFVASVFPMGVMAGKTTRLQFIGDQVPKGQSATYSVEKKQPLGPTRVQLAMTGGLSNPVNVVVSDLPQFVENAKQNDSPKSDQPVKVPCGISGKIEKSSDIDCFTFDAKKGEKFSIEVCARRYGSRLDSHLRILDAKTGRQYTLNDDMKQNRRTFADSQIENWTVPADGKYTIEIRDLHLSGSEQHGYYLNVTRAQPYFELYLDTDKTQLSPGTSAVIFARVIRKNGFTGEIALDVDGLPAGVTAVCGRILTGKSQDGCIVLTAAKNAGRLAKNIIVRGTTETRVANGESRKLSTIAIARQETYMPGGGRSHWHVDMHTVAIGEPGDIRSLKLNTNHLTIKPGDSKRIEITIERAPGFNKNVTLDLLYRHLSSMYGNTLPPGVTIDSKNSKTLLTGNISKGHITLKAAPTAKAVEKQQISVMANISLNFVMKATYSGPPLTITVQKP